jgi:hypothetical protein
MHADWFNRIDILQGRWKHGEKVGYCYPSGLEKILFKWEIYVLLVMKGYVIKHMKITLIKLALKIKPIVCPKTSITNYQSMLHNIPQ